MVVDIASPSAAAAKLPFSATRTNTAMLVSRSIRHSCCGLPTAGAHLSAASFPEESRHRIPEEKPMTRLRLAALAATSLIAALPAFAAPTVLPLPADWYPESLAAGPDGRLYVGSWRQGAVARVDPATGTVAAL